MRSEYKYLIPFDRLPDLREMVRPFVLLDDYAEEGGGQYTVRSIYFDTSTLANYHEKIEGLRLRRKLRMRGYNYGDEDSLVFLEIKRRVGKPIAKNRAPLRYGDVPHLFSTGAVEDLVKDFDRFPRAFDDARRFLYNYHRYHMAPTVNVVYEREAYVGKMDRTVRVTFDKNLRSVIFPSLDALYEDNGLRRTFDRHFILEIKFYGLHMPVWARKIVQRLEVKQQALSKYTLCMDAHPDPRTRFSARPRAAALPSPAPDATEARLIEVPN